MKIDCTLCLHDYETGAELRAATAQELAESIAASSRDGGAGVIMVVLYRGTVREPRKTAASHWASARMGNRRRRVMGAPSDA